MKSIQRLIFTLIIPLALASCFKQTQTVNSGGGSTTGDDGGGSTASGGTNGTNGSNGSNGTNGSTNGNTNSDGSPSNPLITLTFKLAGQVGWIPRNSNGDAVTLTKCRSGLDSSPYIQNTHCQGANDNLRSSAIPSVLEANNVFMTNVRRKVRLTILDQPSPPAPKNACPDGICSQEKLQSYLYCFGRNRGAVSIGPYQSLDFEYGLRRVSCPRNAAGDVTGECTLGSYHLVNRASASVGQSVVLDLTNSYLPPTSHAKDSYVLYIDDVRTHETGGGGGPKSVAEASCWSMKMEIETDSTIPIQ